MQGISRPDHRPRPHQRRLRRRAHHHERHGPRAHGHRVAPTASARAIEAAQQAISSPLLEDVSINGATGILINITGGPDLTLAEVNEACTLIQEAAHDDANIIFGSVIDANFGDEVRITVIATGFDRAGRAHGRSDLPRARVERKRATQIAMPYIGVPAAARPHVPPTQSPRTISRSR